MLWGCAGNAHSHGVTEKRGVYVQYFAQYTNEDRRIQRQFLTFDNRDTIPVCHHNGMKTFNTEGEQTLGFTDDSTLHILTVSIGFTITQQSYTPLQLFVQVSLQILHKKKVFDRK